MLQYAVRMLQLGNDMFQIVQLRVQFVAIRCIT